MAYGSRGSLLRRVVILRGKPEVFTKTGRDLPGFWKTRGGLFAGKNANVGEIDKSPQENVGEMAKSPQENVGEMAKSPQENVDGA